MKLKMSNDTSMMLMKLFTMFLDVLVLVGWIIWIVTPSKAIDIHFGLRLILNLGWGNAMALSMIHLSESYSDIQRKGLYDFLAKMTNVIDVRRKGMQDGNGKKVQGI